MELDILFFSVLGLFILFNLLVAFHARGILHFHIRGMSATAPESLSFRAKLKIAFFGLRLSKPKGSVEIGSLSPSYSHRRIPLRANFELDAWVAAPSFRPCWVLMLHGFVAEKTSLIKEAEAFQEMGLRPFLIDFRGNGESSGFDTTIGYREAEDVKAAVAFIRAEYPSLPILIYGKSMGAAAALRAVAKLDVAADGLILECPYDNLLRTVKNRFRLINAPATPFAELLLFWGSVLSRFNGFKLNPETYASRVKIPTLVIAGENDSRAKPEEVKRVFDALQGVKHLEIIGKASHDEIFDENPELWKRTVSSFIHRDVLTIRD